jgi:signal transduction histidine kinase
VHVCSKTATISSHLAKVTAVTIQTFDFRFHPNLVSRELGRDMYRAPEALKQLVANALDAGSTRVDIEVLFNQLDAPERVTIRDDGHGISPKEMDEAFRTIGLHLPRATGKREIIGSRGIGRFAVFALSAEAHWQTLAETPVGMVRQELDNVFEPPGV